MLQLRQRMGQQQRLTPVQVQYLKLLQLPAAELDERIKEELEENPMLEEIPQDELPDDTLATSIETSIIPTTPSESSTERDQPQEATERDNEYTLEDYINDETEGFKVPRSKNYDDDDREERGQVAEETLTESLINQLSLLDLSPRMRVLAEEIIGSLDEDGYLRVPLEQIEQDTSIYYGEEYAVNEAERLLKRIQRLDPVGIASRSLQECLLVQLDALTEHTPARKRALEILHEHFELFIKKNYQILAKKLHLELVELKPAFDLIQHLNPKPGAPSAPNSESQRYITPDFYIEKTPDQKEFIITLNERGVPSIRINASYKELTKKGKVTNGRSLPDDAREFINKKFEAAKAFVLAYYQRRKTLLAVMQAIVARQKEFFINGEKFLRPMIYKNIADDITMDISTVCRVVNGKYCQSNYGVHELKYFFSEAIPLGGSDDAGDPTSEMVSNKVVKARIKELVSEENPMKPLTDDELAVLLHETGYTLARRTVAKYREQMNIPVARMRKRIV